MLVVMSNDGHWDADMFGVVAVIPNIEALKDVAETMSDTAPFEVMTQPIVDWLDENESSLCCYEGKVVGAVIHKFDDIVDTVYVAIDLNAVD